jgi:hypothetical protein
MPESPDAPVDVRSTPGRLPVIDHPYFQTGSVLFREQRTHASTGTTNSPDMMHFSQGSARSSPHYSRPACG